MKIDFNKKYSDLNQLEKNEFYKNVRDVTYKYICKNNIYSELAYETIDDSFIKAIKKAKKDVNIKSFRSYVGTIAWREFNKRKQEVDKKIQYYDRLEQRYDVIDDFENNNIVLKKSMIYAIKRLTALDKKKLRDMIRTNIDYQTLSRIWGMENLSCRQAVFKVRKKLKKYLSEYTKKGEAV